ncbi:MAG: hypothetical protein AB4426_14715 [Xenococcaceae cyanobacterium]
MAKLSDETITTVLNLQRQFLERIDEATAIEFALFEQFGETEATIPELEELQNIRERADSYYSRFYTVLRRIYESQPVASNANLELLARTIQEAQATTEAIRASIQDIKRNWNLS